MGMLLARHYKTQEASTSEVEAPVVPETTDDEVNVETVDVTDGSVLGEPDVLGDGTQALEALPEYVEGDTTEKVSEPVAVEESTESVPDKSWTKPALIEYAKAHQIDLSDASNNDQRLEKILAASE